MPQSVGVIMSTAFEFDITSISMCRLCLCPVHPQIDSYYLSHGGAENKCPFAPCKNALLGREYVRGWFVEKGSCDTVRILDGTQIAVCSPHFDGTF